MVTQAVRIGFFMTVLTCLGAASTSAQENTTILMRSGERLSAQLIDMGGVGFNVVVNGEERQIPVSDVAAIEFAGAADPAPAEVPRQAGRRPPHSLAAQRRRD